MARAWVRASSELAWIGSRADREIELDTLEGRVLTLLVRRPRWVMSDVREAVGVDRRVMSRLFGRLENRGWVTREGPADDLRHVMIAATEAGRTSWAKAEDRRVDLLAALIGGVEDGEVPATDALTRRLAVVMRRFDQWGFWDPRFYRRARFADRGAAERLHER